MKKTLSAVMVAAALSACKTTSPDASSETKDVTSDCHVEASNKARATPLIGRQARYKAFLKECIDRKNAGNVANGSDYSDDVLIVNVNGRGSCRLRQIDKKHWPMNLYTWVPSLHLGKDFQEEGVRARHLHVCLFAAERRLFDEKVQIYVLYTDQNGKLQTIGDGAFGGGLLGQVFVTDLPKIIGDLAVTASGEKMPVVLIGHSYGGWAAMYAAAKSASHFRTQALFTLDPISPFDCDAFDLMPTVVGGQPKAGCRKFPRQIETGRLFSADAVTARSKLWLNFYQRQGIIASGAVPGSAGPQVYNSYHFMDNYECGHRYVGANPEVWKIIRQAALINFKNKGARNDDVAQITLPAPAADPTETASSGCKTLVDSGAKWDLP